MLPFAPMPTLLDQEEDAIWSKFLAPESTIAVFAMVTERLASSESALQQLLVSLLVSWQQSSLLLL